MKTNDLSRQFDQLNKYKDSLVFMELLLTRIDSPFKRIFWTKIKELKKLRDEEGNLIFVRENDSYVITPNVKYTEEQFVKMPFPFKRQEEE